MKIVIVGAGSRIFGRGSMVDLLMTKEFKGRDVTLTLVDLDESALERMRRVGERVKEHLQTDVKLKATSDRRRALAGADFVLVAVCRRRLPLWEQDYRVPLSLGFRHCLGENGGPGALFHTMRSLELMMPICRDIEELCPNAWLLNFTNPEARVLHAINHLTKVKAMGLCHGVLEATHWISGMMGIPGQNLHVVSAGMNHFFTILKLVDTRTGTDITADLYRKTLERPEGSIPKLFRQFIETFGVFSYPSDGHIGEYVAWGGEFTGNRWHYAGNEARHIPLVDPPPRTVVLDEYASGQRPVDGDLVRHSGESAAGIIHDLAYGTRGRYPAINTLNREGYIENLPRDGAIEIPCMVENHAIHPETVGALPEAFAALIRMQMAIISVVTEAYRARSKKLLLQALLMDPNVNSTANAKRLIDDMLDLQAEYLPKFE